MRRAGQKNAVACEDIPTALQIYPSRSDAPSPAELRAERNRHLAVAVRQRIESRLRGRLRSLAVRVDGDTVVLEGKCATYYTKQLAQHAALGILEEGEHLENALVVDVPR